MGDDTKKGSAATLGKKGVYPKCKEKEHINEATDYECVVVSCETTSKGANLVVTMPDGTTTETLKAGENTKCIRINRNEKIIVHNQGDDGSVATGTVTQIVCKDCDNQ